MLIIRKEQKEVLAKAARNSFEERMLVHVNKFFPKHYEALGESNCRELVNHGIKKAATYDIVSERDVCKYIDLMIGFGLEFDKDDNLPWAVKIFNDTSWKDASAKTNALFKAGIRHLQD